MSQKAAKEPQLLAFLICERSIMEEDKVVSLIRIVDTFNAKFQLGPGEQSQQVGALIHCEIFTRWGPSEGEFAEEVAIVEPGGKELPQRSQVKYTRPGGFGFYQVHHKMELGFMKGGEYAFSLYLNGKLKAQHPFRVNIEIIPSKPSAS